MSDRYRAFISYSHRDRKWADWLLKRIESYRVPANLAGQIRNGRLVPDRIRPLFKDREELATSNDLSKAVDEALIRSDALIVICSPHARESVWVNEEIRRFREAGFSGRTFPLIVDGDESDAFPPALLEGAEPLAANVAPGQDGKENAALKIIAALLGVTFDELKQRDLQARYRRLLYLSAAGAVGMIALTALTGWAVLSQREADLRRNQADGLIEFMIGDLRKRLEPIGRLDVLDEIGQQAEAYFSTIDAASQDAATLARHGKVTQQLGEVRLLQGDPNGARPNFEEALARQTRAYAIAADPQIRFDLAQTNYWLGYSYWEAGDLDSALPYFEAYADHAATLAEEAPDNLDWQLEVPYSLVNLGTLRFEREQYEQAVAEFLAAIKQFEALRAIAPDDERIEASIGASNAWLAGSYWELGETERAAAAFALQADAARLQIELEPGNYQHIEQLALATQRYGLALQESDEPVAAEAALLESLDQARTLVEREPDNFFWRYAHAKSLWYLGAFYLLAGSRTQAGPYLLEARNHFPTIDNGARPKWLIESSELANDQARHALMTGDREGAADSVQHALTLLGGTTVLNSHRSTANAEALLLGACASGKLDAAQLKTARTEMNSYSQIGRTDFLTIREWVNSANPLSECPDDKHPRQMKRT